MPNQVVTVRFSCFKDPFIGQGYFTKPDSELSADTLKNQFTLLHSLAINDTCTADDILTYCVKFAQAKYNSYLIGPLDELFLVLEPELDLIHSFNISRNAFILYYLNQGLSTIKHNKKSVPYLSLFPSDFGIGYVVPHNQPVLSLPYTLPSKVYISIHHVIFGVINRHIYVNAAEETISCPNRIFHPVSDHILAPLLVSKSHPIYQGRSCEIDTSNFLVPFYSDSNFTIKPENRSSPNDKLEPVQCINSLLSDKVLTSRQSVPVLHSNAKARKSLSCSSDYYACEIERDKPPGSTFDPFLFSSTTHPLSYLRVSDYRLVLVPHRQYTSHSAHHISSLDPSALVIPEDIPLSISCSRAVFRHGADKTGGVPLCPEGRVFGPFIRNYNTYTAGFNLDLCRVRGGPLRVVHGALPCVAAQDPGLHLPFFVRMEAGGDLAHRALVLLQHCFAYDPPAWLQKKCARPAGLSLEPTGPATLSLALEATPAAQEATPPAELEHQKQCDFLSQYQNLRAQNENLEDAIVELYRRKNRLSGSCWPK